MAYRLHNFRTLKEQESWQNVWWNVSLGACGWISCSSNTQYSAKWLLRNADRLPQHPTLPLLDERIITWTIIIPYRWHFNRAYNVLYFVSPNKSTLRKCRLYAFLSWCATTLTLILLTWRIGWTPNNACRWQMGFDLASKWLKKYNH